jgi:hypothetical protein
MVEYRQEAAVAIFPQKREAKRVWVRGEEKVND